MIRFHMSLCLVVVLAGCSESDATPDASPAVDAPGFDASGLDAPGLDAPGFDGGPLRVDAGPVQCGEAEAAGYTLCDATRDTCAIVFDDGAGCPAACARIGLECSMSFDTMDTSADVCSEEDRIGALDCADTGHSSDYCVCARAEEPDAGPGDAGPGDAGPSDAGPVMDAGPPPGVRAFPTAEGAGANAVGGRGGIVVHVTNLNDSGAGSFREAMRMTVPRTIVFDVAGVIELDSLLFLNNEQSNVTVAGQTAPDGGITFTGVRWYFEDVDEVIVRYVRFRGDYSLSQDIVTVAASNNMIFDHVSAAYGGDECLSFSTERVNVVSGAVGGITVQRTIFAESKTGSIIGGRTARPEDAGDVSVLKNLFYDISHRFPNMRGDGNYEVVNNVVHQWSARLLRGNDNLSLNHVNNYYFRGVNHPVRPITQLLNKYEVSSGSPRIYTAGAVIPMDGFLTDPDADNRPLWADFNGGVIVDRPLSDASFVASPHPWLGQPVEILSALEAFADVSSNVGSNARLTADGSVVENMDSLDELYLRNTRDGVRADRSPSDYNVPPIAGGAPYADTDRDGMPDVWERANGFNEDVDDSAGDADMDGYTNLEEFLNLVDA